MRPSSWASSSLVPTPSVQLTSIGSRMPGGIAWAAAKPVCPPATIAAIVCGVAPRGVQVDARVAVGDAAVHAVRVPGPLRRGRARGCPARTAA